MTDNTWQCLYGLTTSPDSLSFTVYEYMHVYAHCGCMGINIRAHCVHLIPPQHGYYSNDISEYSAISQDMHMTNDMIFSSANL